ncbi:Prosaposin [Liparis tanakae]|uniref:Prosaposin n=1 Tax=Liparis tanakae TaxID=230148 RepID=A0A4Z2I0A2_9TELE|nr:Prosaposin [Liparis tanakae]
MMALLKMTLILFAGLQGCALNSAFHIDGLQSIPDALRAKKMMDGIESLCDHLLEPATAALCKEEVEKMLPLVINVIAGVAKPAEVCKVIGLCGSFDTQEKISHFDKEALQEAVIKLLEQMCRVLPSSYRDQCEAVIGSYSKAVLDAILSYATPQVICALIQLCQVQEAPLVDPCTLATYRCRDVTTARKCGTVFYCHKFVWKPLNTL